MPQTNTLVHRYYAVNDLVLSPSPWRPDITPTDAVRLMDQELKDARSRPDFSEVKALKWRLSMLHIDTLIRMRYLAAVTGGAVVEFGAYVGGSTVMLARGTLPPRKIITIEQGCSNPTHSIPTLDSVEDLKKNLLTQGLSERVTVLHMASWEPRARAAVEEVLQGDKISLLCIDSDGHPLDDLKRYRPLLAPGCVVVIDDVIDTGQNSDKSTETIPQLNDLLSTGDLVEFGNYEWATFFGRLAIK